MKDIVWTEESNDKPYVCQKRKRKVGKRKLEFIDWGSRPLIEFLQAIGQNTSVKHSRHDVARFITKYINDNGLSSAGKKKKVLCDERLYSLFGKKTMPRVKIYDMLEEHFAENHDDSDEELYSSEDDYGELGKSNPTSQVKKVTKTPKSCFAAVIPENIKLVYLKKSLVQELREKPDEFECKLVGSFVRMKSDPNDIYQKNRFQLQLVTGVEKGSGDGGAGDEILLKVSNFFKDVPISMLSDDNFTEEELEDVRDRTKADLLKRLTVKELELKAQMLHTDITKHWIVEELCLLQKLIDRANEKGWRRELFGYLERRKMLQTPAEQHKLLLNIPQVIAEELVPEGILEAASGKAEGDRGSPKSILRRSSDVSSTDASGSGSGDVVAPSRIIFSDSPPAKVQFGSINIVVPAKDVNGDHPAENGQEKTWIADVACGGTGGSTADVISVEKVPQEKPKAVYDVIELSDDESEDEDHQRNGECPEDAIWHYSDPQGLIQGPFSLNALKRWRDLNYFDSGFRVWKIGQSSENAVLLVDVLGQIFPH